MGAIIGEIAKFIGYIINWIYIGLNSLPAPINNVGITIIIFTIVVYMIMYPMTYKQQKFAKITSKIQPEISAIQAKYKGKNDNESRMKMNEETQYIYDKYGVSPMGNCLPLLIQFPILIAVYRVAISVGDYVNLKGEGYNNFLLLDVTNSPIQSIKSAWSTGKYGIIAIAILVPVLSGLTQWLNLKLSTAGQSEEARNNPAMKSMQTMNIFMPLFSVFMVFSLPVAAGIYWIMGAVVRSVQQFFLNKHFDKLDFDAIVEKNKEKAEAKREKREGYTSKMIANNGTMKTRNFEAAGENKEAIDKANELRKTAKSGSMASKANLVSDYNNRNNRNDQGE
ncbi:MAG: YidC/Oxa1 family membrane protein insertase [Lachnospiraceae bacterium]|nr:YidC/Oxa1 family membrane protein insertase [Lachnospiraceae bacterium]MBR5788555.1 YidC/Oxa1 family membrane protein insertase [Lachnospiraceae bacterium]